MSREFLLAILFSASVHGAVIFCQLPVRNVLFDVERGPVSVQIDLVEVEEIKDFDEKEVNEEVEKLTAEEKIETKIKSSEVETTYGMIEKGDQEFKEFSVKIEKIKSIYYPREEEGAKTFIEPSYLVNKAPKYPEVARRKGIEGKTLLLVEVLSSGKCGKIKISETSGYEILDQQAIKSVSEWKFIPARNGHKNFKSLVKIPIKFELVD